MFHFCRKDHLACCIIDERQPGRFTAWVDYEQQGGGSRFLHRWEQDQGKGKAPIDCRFFSRKQMACASRMDRLKWSFLAIQHKHFGHLWVPFLLPGSGPPLARVMFASTMTTDLYVLLSTGFNH